MELDSQSPFTGTVINFDGKDCDFRSILQITKYYQVRVTIYDITPDIVNQIREGDYCCACIKLDEGDYFSLFDIQVSEQSYSVFPDHLPIKGTATLLARYAIRGSKCFFANDTFAKFSVEITDGYELIGLCPYDLDSLIMDMFHRNPIHISINNSSIVSNISLGKITFAAYPRPNFSKDALSFGFQHQITIDLNTPISPREFSKVLGPLTDFISILCGEFVRINRLNLIADTFEGRNDPYEFIGYCNCPRPRLKLLQANGRDTTGYLRTSLFKISDFSDISYSIDKWLSYINNNPSLVLAHNAYGRIMMDEDAEILTTNRYLAAMQLIEGYVFAFYSKKAVAKQFDAQKKRIKSLLDSPADKQLISEYLITPGYVFKEAVSLFLSDGMQIFVKITKDELQEKFGPLIDAIVKERIRYTHSTRFENDQLEFHRLVRIASLCKDFYRASMLKRVGLSDGLIKARFSSNFAFASYFETVFGIKLDFTESLSKFDKDMWYFSDSEKVTQ